MAQPEQVVPVGSAGADGASMAQGAAPVEQPGAVWLLEDARRGRDEACLAIVERLGVEFRRLPLCWTMLGGAASLSRRGSLAGLKAALPLAGEPPRVTLSSGARPGAVARWLKHNCGSRMVRYGARPERDADLLIADSDAALPEAGVLRVLGTPHRLSPLAIRAAQATWQERLDHLPRPRLALMLGTGPFEGEVQPLEAYRLGAGLATAVHGAGGCVVAMTDRRTGREAADALAQGLSGCLHLLHRGGEPGADPELGFLSAANLIVVAGNASAQLMRACALPVPVYVADAGPIGLAAAALRRRLLAADQVRLLRGELAAWTRPALDEAARAAGVVHALVV